MTEQNKHLETLSEIRSLMERSSRFISLSGLSGVAAGTFALIGAYVAHLYLNVSFFKQYNYFSVTTDDRWGLSPLQFFFLDGGLVLALALGFGIFFTVRKSKKAGQKVWNKTAGRVLINLFIPLATGGIFCLILLFKYSLEGLVAPATLIFYGLALLNASKYTLDDIRYLGVTQIILGLIGSYYIGYGLLIWAIGFGVLHIVYGTMMWWKYEK